MLSFAMKPLLLCLHGKKIDEITALRRNFESHHLKLWSKNAAKEVDDSLVSFLLL